MRAALALSALCAACARCLCACFSYRWSVSMATCVAMVFCTVTGNANELPNIILIMADDLGPGDLGFLGQSAIQTPHIDALWRAACTCPDITPAAPSVPSRSCLLTGQHTGRTFVQSNKSLPPPRSIGHDGRPISATSWLYNCDDCKAGTGPAVEPGHVNSKGFDTFWLQLPCSASLFQVPL